MNADRRAEILLVRDACVVFDEAEVPARIVARLLSELVGWCDFLTRANEDLAKIEEKADELRERLDQEAANTNELASKLLETEGKLATAEHDRNVLAERLGKDLAEGLIASAASKSYPHPRAG